MPDDDSATMDAPDIATINSVLGVIMGEVEADARAITWTAHGKHGKLVEPARMTPTGTLSVKLADTRYLVIGLVDLDTPHWDWPLRAAIEALTPHGRDESNG